MDIAAIALDCNPWWMSPHARPLPHAVHRRDLFDVLHAAFVDPRQGRAQVLLGPRQVGKSWLMWQLVTALLDAGAPPGNVMFFDLSDDRLPRRSVSPRALTALSPPGLDRSTVRYFLFDEITWAASGWDRWLKQAVDESRRAASGRGDRFIVTSSAASLLRSASRESGQGRWDNHFLEGMTFSEYERLADAGSPEATLRYLRTGGYPGLLADDDPGLRRKRLREDIIDRAILHDLLVHEVDVGRVMSLFTYLVQTSGNQWEAGNRARDLDADPRTVSLWLRLLEQTGLLSLLPRWTPGKSGSPGKASSELRQHPKVFASDHALVLAFSAQPSEAPEVQARVFEAAVYRHLRSLTDSDAELAYLRVDDRHELDFAIRCDGRWLGVEVTTTRSLEDWKLGRLIAAGARMRAERLVLIYGGLFDGEREGVRVIPIHRFLGQPRAALEISGR